MILGLEWSSVRVSAALWEEGRVREEVCGMNRFRAPEALRLVMDLLAHADAQPGDLQEIRVGCGPGNHTGVRQALSLAAGWAAPGGIRTVGLCSGRLMQIRWFGEQDTPCWILGDARRGMWWGACADTVDSDLTWTLRTPAEWIRLVGRDPVLSPDANRLQGLDSRQWEPRAADLVGKPVRFPVRPPAPVYLHPPVG